MTDPKGLQTAVEVVGLARCWACDGNGYSGGDIPCEEMRGEMDVCCEVCLGTGKARQHLQEQANV